jgi:hypothetical protein
MGFIGVSFVLQAARTAIRRYWSEAAPIGKAAKYDESIAPSYQ